MKQVPTVSQIHKAGFTFVELLVVITIIGLFSGGGIVSFIDFRDRQNAISQVKKVAEQLRLAQRKALAGEKPAECDLFTLSGYQVDIQGAGSQIVVEPVCSGGSPTPVIIDLTPSTVSASVLPVVFNSVRGGATTSEIEVCTGDILYRLNVSETGSVGEPELVDGGC